MYSNHAQVWLLQALKHKRWILSKIFHHLGITSAQKWFSIEQGVNSLEDSELQHDVKKVIKLPMSMMKSQW